MRSNIIFGDHSTVNFCSKSGEMKSWAVTLAQASDLADIRRNSIDNFHKLLLSFE